MPKFGAHILIAQLAESKQPNLIGRVTNPMRLGAIGPDLTLFLFDPFVKDPTIRRGFDIALQALRLKHQLTEELEKVKKIFDVQQDIANWLTGGISADLIRIAESSLDALLLTLKLGVAVGTSPIKFNNPIYPLIASGQISPALILNELYRNPDLIVEATDTFGFPFRYFGHPYTDDKGWHNPVPVGDYSEWWWMDMLHYRKTGRFATSLMAVAAREGSSAMRDYAVGYLSHVAGDICGHPYINALVHGPFRNHAYRHIVVEGLADTWLWNRVFRADISESAMHKLIELRPNELNEICRLLRIALMETYVPPELPNLLSGRYPSEEELRGAYGFMFEYLKLSTGGKVSRPQKPPENPKEVLDELQQLLSKYAPTAPPTWNSSDPWASILAALGWIVRGVAFLIMIATLPAAILARFLAGPIRWLLYLIHLAIYTIVSGLRSLLALMGWGYASNDDFQNFSMLEDLVTVDPRKLQGIYPLTSPQLRPRPPFYWLFPPRDLRAGQEQNGTKVVGSNSNYVLKPDWIISPTNKMLPKHLLQRFYDAKTPVETLRAQITTEGGFGNAVDFFIALMKKELPIEDFDLDGDRGFGYKPWDVLPPNEKYF